MREFMIEKPLAMNFKLGGPTTIARCLACFVGCMVMSCVVGSGALIFSENMGTTASGNPSVSVFTGFQNYGTLTYAGSGDLRTTTPSVGYTGASGSDNVFLTQGGTRSFLIGSINTLGYSGLTLSFGAYKSTLASSLSELSLGYSIDGGATFSALNIPDQTGTGAVWRMISGISLPANAEGVSNLLLRWVNTSPAGTGTPQFRIDDVVLEGAVVPEPSTWLAGALLALPFGVHGVRYLRNRKRA